MSPDAQSYIPTHTSLLDLVKATTGPLPPYFMNIFQNVFHMRVQATRGKYLLQSVEGGWEN